MSASTAPRVPAPIGDVARGEVPHPIKDLPRFLERIEREGPVVAFEVDGAPWTFVRDPELADRIFRLPPPFLEVGPGPITEVFSVSGGFGDSIAMNFSPRWRPRRLVIQRPLSHRNVRGYGEVIAHHVHAHVASWPAGRDLVAQEEMRELTLSTLAATLFTEEIVRAKRLILEFDRIRNDDFRASSASPDRVPGTSEEYVRALGELEAFIYEMIARRRRDPDLDDILGMLVNAVDENGDALDDRAVRDETVTLIYAGFTTTANTLTFSISLLGRHPDVLERLRAQVDAEVGDRLPTVDDLDRIPLARQIVDETLRLYPVAYWIDRRARTDIEVGGYVIPAGAGIMFSPWLAQHDERYFPDPERFDPDRFAPARRKEIDPRAYFPFGAGPRICAGNHLALLEASFAVATIAQRVELELVDDAPPELHFAPLFEPRDPLLFRVRPR